jgi:hypothetical protein
MATSVCWLLLLRERTKSVSRKNISCLSHCDFLSGYSCRLTSERNCRHWQSQSCRFNHICSIDIFIRRVQTYQKQLFVRSLNNMFSFSWKSRKVLIVYLHFRCSLCYVKLTGHSLMSLTANYRIQGSEIKHVYTCPHVIRRSLCYLRTRSNDQSVNYVMYLA